MSAKFPLKIQKDNIWIDSKTIPSKALITELDSLRVGEALEKNGEVIAFRSAIFDLKKINKKPSIQAAFIEHKNITLYHMSTTISKGIKKWINAIQMVILTVW